MSSSTRNRTPNERFQFCLLFRKLVTVQAVSIVVMNAELRAGSQTPSEVLDDRGPATGTESSADSVQKIEDRPKTELMLHIRHGKCVIEVVFAWPQQILNDVPNIGILRQSHSAQWRHQTVDTNRLRYEVIAPQLITVVGKYEHRWQNMLHWIHRRPAH